MIFCIPQISLFTKSLLTAQTRTSCFISFLITLPSLKPWNKCFSNYSPSLESKSELSLSLLTSVTILLVCSHGHQQFSLFLCVESIPPPWEFVPALWFMLTNGTKQKRYCVSARPRPSEAWQFPLSSLKAQSYHDCFPGDIYMLSCSKNLANQYILLWAKMCLSVSPNSYVEAQYFRVWLYLKIGPKIG